MAKISEVIFVWTSKIQTHFFVFHFVETEKFRENRAHQGVQQCAKVPKCDLPQSVPVHETEITFFQELHNMEPDIKMSTPDASFAPIHTGI